MTDPTDVPKPPSSLFCAVGSEEMALTDEDIKKYLHLFLDALGPREDVLILPPDYTRFHSQAGKITRFVSEHYNFTAGVDSSTKSSSSPVIQILPALGTHVPMTQAQIESMFGEELAKKEPSPFLVHDWRKDVVTIGHAPASMVSEATNGMVDREWPAQLNRHVWEKRVHNPERQPHRSLVLSVGQVVPHEVMGMANFNKNLFVGVGGVEAINLSHFISAVCGMEKLLGRAFNPLRSILNYASEKYLQSELDLWYILTVMGTNKETGDVEMRGLYIGNDIECYTRACDLSLKVNFTLLDEAPKRMVVHLDESEFHSMWLGNKAIYRTRMAIADGGELIILAPGVKQFGEDEKIDELIRLHGYVGTPQILEAMDKSKELQENLSAVAHLMHGSSEGRFNVIYCPGHLTKQEVEGVGFQYRDLDTMLSRYNVSDLKDGWNVIENEKGENDTFFFISNPALGLWSVKSRFHEAADNICDSKVSAVSTSVAQKASSSSDVGGWAKPPTTAD